jgi:hypothetical protein
MEKLQHPFKKILDAEIQSWTNYRRGLRPEDRPYFDRVMAAARKHWKAGAGAGRIMTSESIIMSVLVEQQKTLDDLRIKLNTLSDKSASNSH